MKQTVLIYSGDFHYSLNVDVNFNFHVMNIIAVLGFNGSKTVNKISRYSIIIDQCGQPFYDYVMGFLITSGGV